MRRVQAMGVLAARGVRACAAAPEQPAAAAPAVLPAEKAEHDAFVRATTSDGVVMPHVMPLKTCSTQYLMRVGEAAKAGGPEAPLYDFRRGRGLVLQKAVPEGTTLMRAPLDTVGFNVQTIEQRRALLKNPDASPAHAAARGARPGTRVIHAVLNDLMYRDPYYGVQFDLALLLAWERCAPTSVVGPYLNTLPVPAIDDTAVLEAHCDSLTSSQAREYKEFGRDFVSTLLRLRASWVEAVDKLPIDAALKAEAKGLVPPVGVLEWAFRIVLSRMTPMPTNGVAPAPSCFKGSAFNSVNYVEWFRLTEREHQLLPTLLPMFDLVDHSPDPTVQLDLILRVPGDNVDTSRAAIKAREKFGPKPKRQRIVAPRSTLDVWIRQLRQSVLGGKGFDDAAADPDAGVPEGSVPHVELRAMRDLEADEPLTVSYSTVSSWAFTLYRYGFVPMMRE